MEAGALSLLYKASPLSGWATADTDSFAVLTAGALACDTSLVSVESQADRIINGNIIASIVVFILITGIPVVFPLGKSRYCSLIPDGGYKAYA
jgi:hypothetical protein